MPWIIVIVSDKSICDEYAMGDASSGGAGAVKGVKTAKMFCRNVT